MKKKQYIYPHHSSLLFSKKVLKAMIKKMYLILHKRSVMCNTSKLPLLLFPQLTIEYPQVLIACIHLKKKKKKQPFICIHSAVNPDFLTHLLIQAELLQNTTIRIKATLIRLLSNVLFQVLLKFLFYSESF